MALQRDNKSLFRMGDGSLKIFPDPKFLAKNEDPLQRRGPVLIKPLVDGDETLCPVKSLNDYINATSRTSSHKLFVHPTHLGSWNRSGLSVSIARLIKQSQPHTFPRSHDVRKISASLAFLGNMSIDDINSRVGWRSRRVFKKHYLLNIKETIHKCVSLN